MEKVLKNNLNGQENTYKLMFSLVRSELRREENNAYCSDEISDEVLRKLYCISNAHDIAHYISSALYRNRIGTNSKIYTKFVDKQMLAVYRYETMKCAIDEICSTLGKHMIRYVLLKGAAIRPYYPEEWLRSSCDIDILVHEEDLNVAVKALVQDNGYTTDNKVNYHDVSLFSKSGVHLELHYNIKEHMDNIDRLLSDVWNYTYKDADVGYRYIQEKEFFAFHTIAHMSYHFVNGGCGIKPFIDLYVIQNKMTYDEKKLREYCRRCKIERFYDNVMYLMQVWFCDKKHTEVSLKMENYILSGGVYGSSENKIVVSYSKRGGKLGYLFSKVFISYDLLSVKHPVLKKHKWLTPIFQVRRWMSSLRVGRIKHLLREEKSVYSNSEDDIVEMRAFLKELGL
ncbi:MAG: nucleotidyltransferase family protein [Oscillospiraceae bacterium]|nr:nucleotidyltransferase family protein [Oscillospiraceae bacterium]